MPPIHLPRSRTHVNVVSFYRLKRRYQNSAVVRGRRLTFISLRYLLKFTLKIGCSVKYVNPFASYEIARRLVLYAAVIKKRLAENHRIELRMSIDFIDLDYLANTGNTSPIIAKGGEPEFLDIQMSMDPAHLNVR